MSLRNLEPEALRQQSRRDFIKKAAAGTIIVALGGGLYRSLPPGQKVIEELRPMGGEAGSARTDDFRLQIHGEVERPFTIDWKQLLAMPATRPS